MPKGMDMAAGFDQAFGKGTAAPKDYGRELGDGLLQSLVQGVAERTRDNLLTPTESKAAATDSLDAALAQMVKLKVLKEFTGDHDDQGGTMATILKAVLEMQAKTTATLSEAQSKSEERSLKLFEKMTEQQQQFFEKVETKLRDGGRPDEFGDLAKAMLVQQLQSNPVDAYKQQRDQFFEEFKALHGTKQQADVVDFERYKFDKELEIKTAEDKAKADAEQARWAHQEKILGGLLGAVGKGNGNGGPAPQSEGASSPPPFFRVHCAACQATFALNTPPQPGQTLTCPACQQIIRVNGGDEPPAPVMAPSAPPPPPSMADDLALDDLIGGGY